MKIDELIAVLEKVKVERGNMAVDILDADTDSVLTIDKVGFTNGGRLVVWGWYTRNGRWAGDNDEIVNTIWERKE